MQGIFLGLEFSSGEVDATASTIMYADADAATGSTSADADDFVLVEGDILLSRDQWRQFYPEYVQCVQGWLHGAICTVHHEDGSF